MSEIVPKPSDSVELIDSHCHLARLAAEGKLEAILERAGAAGVGQMIAVGTRPEDWIAQRSLAQAHPERLSYTVGLHPCYVDEAWEQNITQISPMFIPPEPPVALGEIGLDHYHLPKDPVEAGKLILQQEEAFVRQLELAYQMDCPVVIHSRDCFEDTLRLIDESGVDWTRVVFHCFTYGPEEMAALIERGARASFTGIVTYKNAPAIREAAKLQGIEKLMVETDCPYLSPEPVRKAPNEPANVRHTAAFLANLLDLPLADFAAQTTANTRQFFKL